MSVDRFREYDAAYVLGALASDDRRAFEAHLAECRDCAMSLRDLAGLPGLLATVPHAVAEATDGGTFGAGVLPPGVEDPPDTLLPALVRRVRKETVRRRWATGVVAGAAAIATGVILLATPARPGGPVTAATPSASSGPSQTSRTGGLQREMRALGSSGMRATVTLVGVAWGTRLELTCSYDVGGYAREAPTGSYVLVVRDRTGHSEQVAHWRVAPGTTMRVTGASAFPVADIATIEVQSAQGEPLLAVTT